MENNDKPYSILIIDDEADIAEILSLMLSSDFKTETVTSFCNFQKKFKENHYNLVITDLKMPDCSGHEVLEFVAKESQSTPVIIMSGYDEFNDDVHSMLNKGAKLLIKKPFENMAETIVEMKKIIELAL